MRPEARRCAIYTRTSSEEGLEQDFNSLHAQREACEAFIKSQRSEGWRLIPTAYDDGGISGGTMERPALQRLMADIAAGRVDTVVVYKVDRLTRSLADFAKMVELFDKHGVSFVAVTQQFNTTTSMGRLTLNILLSFAQFEREVTGERIRDKIAASKRKGMWMGGYAPLGYDAWERKLQVNEAEAQLVQFIFERYLTLGCVRRLEVDLAERGISTKPRDGRHKGGVPFSRGSLYKLLQNPVYIGRIRHKDASHPGLHEAIVSIELWERVQTRLKENMVGEPRGRQTLPSPLLGKLVDEAGEPLTPSHAVKNGRRYRYYISKALVTGTADAGGWRLPAEAIERVVAAEARRALQDRTAVIDALQSAGVAPTALADEAGRIAAMADLSDRRILDRVQRVELAPDRINVVLPLEIAGANEPVVLERIATIQMKRRGVEMKLVVAGDTTPSKADPALLKAIARARRWFDDLASGRQPTVGAIAEREGVSGRYVRHLLPLAFLSPEITLAIVEGRQPPHLSAQTLTVGMTIPADWTRQAEVLGFA